MPEPASPRWRAAVDQVRGRLADILGTEPTPLDPRALASYHHRFRIKSGWRLPVDFGEREPRRIDVLIPAGFPSSRPQFGLVERPPFLTWPHIERDGSLCLLANMSEIDPDDPVGVVERLLGKSCSLVEDLLEGPMIERDFRDEFLTYWRYDRNAADSRLTSILSLKRPSREIRAWQAPNIRLLGETEAQVTEWLRNRYGPDPLRRSRFERGLLMWLDSPMLPAEYPRTARDVLGLADRCGGDVPGLLADLVSERQDNLVVAFAAEGRFGPGIVSVAIPAPRDSRRSRGRSTAPLSDGFRSANIPDGVLARRYLGTTKVVRDEPKRADAAWIHGRGHDPRTERLMAATVTVLGCGSVGAPVAVALAQAGVGRLNLVDHDELSWANVGRHPLGAASVRSNKAEALAAKLRVDYPHGRFEAFPVSAQTMLAAHEGCLDENDLIVSCMGDWRGETLLNDWHCRRGRPMPVVYGWTESHAAAGHAVAIVRGGGCLRCGLGRTGVPEFQVVNWPNDAGTTLEEPACGAHYQPYGPIELGFVSSLVAQLALDGLLGKIAISSARIYAALRSTVEDLGGRWTADWVREYPARVDGGAFVDRAWSSGPCVACSRPKTGPAEI
ncbi:ThiF family adenylyltransferase [Methylobacterium fujisawaense]|uniref:ThiF family adenylyltransferase n=1 Tax=Methylobacterium fujisawaense TaxID=107400 RepID=UPI0031F5B3AC